MLTLQISEPSNPSQRAAIRQVLHQEPYRKGTDPYLYVNLAEFEEPRLVLLRLNQLEGVRASVLGEQESPERPPQEFRKPVSAG